MTDKIEWGPEIAVNGVRPDWFGDHENISACGKRTGAWYTPAKFGDHEDLNWDQCGTIRLPASHPYYTVLAWNEAHPDEEPFVPWCGGDEAPGDWDGGEVVLRNGCFMLHPQPLWWHLGGDAGGDIIGYRRRKEPASEPVAPPGYVLVKQMTRDEAHSWLNDKRPGWYSEYQVLLMLLELQGAIRPETRLEQFERESGIAITDGNRDAVVAALEWGRD